MLMDDADGPCRGQQQTTANGLGAAPQGSVLHVHQVQQIQERRHQHVEGHEVRRWQRRRSGWMLTEDPDDLDGPCRG